MWTATYKLRPVTRCKEGCRSQPPGLPGGVPLTSPRKELRNRTALFILVCRHLLAHESGGLDHA